MLINVSEAKKTPGFYQEYSWRETAQSLQLHESVLQEGIWLVDQADVHMKVSNVTDRLLFSGTVSARIKLTCGRCLAEFLEDISVAFKEHLLLSVDKTHQVENDDPMFEPVELLEGNMVDATEIAADALLSCLPMNPLCSEECLGLCPVCGQDLNQKTCECSEKEVDPRLAVLAEWLDKK